MTSKRDEDPVEAAGVPDEEGIEEADVAEGVERDPESQPSLTETHPEEAERIRREAQGQAPGRTQRP